MVADNLANSSFVYSVEPNIFDIIIDGGVLQYNVFLIHWHSVDRRTQKMLV